MFLCASRLPSCAPGCVPSHGSANQITAGIVRVTEHIVAKPADIDELLCAAVLSVFRSCKHNE